MNNLQIFNNPEFGQVRTIVKNDEVWFVGKDIAVALGYSNASKAVSTHVDEEDKQFVMANIADSQNGNVPIGQSKTAIINESGLYSLVLSSKLPTAKQFKRWVTSEVLPLIRKTGSYNIQKLTTNELKAKHLEIMERNTRSREAKIWLELYKRTNRTRVKEISESYIANTLAGSRILELPKVEKQTYSAKKIGDILGISANMVGRLANKFNLKTSEYGDYFYDTAKHSNKEVETFRYYENAINEFRRVLIN